MIHTDPIAAAHDAIVTGRRLAFTYTATRSGKVSQRVITDLEIVLTGKGVRVYGFNSDGADHRDSEVRTFDPSAMSNVRTV